MAEYVDLELKVEAQYYDEMTEECSLKTVTIRQILDSVFIDYQPADVAEVVRCAECKHLVPYDGIVGAGVYECERLKTIRTGVFPPMGFYCAWGEKIERKDDAPDA